FDEHLFGHRPLVLEVNRLADTLRKLAPDMFSEQIFEAASQERSRLGIHVRVAPLVVERDERIADACQHFIELFFRGFEVFWTWRLAVARVRFAGRQTLDSRRPRSLSPVRGWVAVRFGGHVHTSITV